VPASNPAGAGMSRHLRPRNGAGESFVSFMRLLGGLADDRTTFYALGRRAKLIGGDLLPAFTSIGISNVSNPVKHVFKT
jgi:hypothetical protein